MMDTDGVSHPMTWNGPQGDLPYENKIYFMGIIDILQQYNSRKRVETTYRKWETHGEIEPSCVSPREYAKRFVRFFDEYSGKSKKSTANGEEGSAVRAKTIGVGNATVPNSVEIRVPSSAADEYKRPQQTILDPSGKRVVSQKGPFVVS